MVIITLTKENVASAIVEAVAVLNRGGIIAYPTETFYGLGVKFDMPESLERLYDIKKRPREKAMPVVIDRRESLPRLIPEEALQHIPPATQSLMERFWPGPVTLLFPAKPGLSEYLTAATGLIAVRVPGESFALQLAARAGFPITATSANPSGRPPAGSAEAVVSSFGDGIDLLIDGGRTPGGLPSTIVDVSGKPLRIVREGAMADTIASFLNEQPAFLHPQNPESMA
jgi:L-threonylcarbamoyladenylate synthase